MEVEPVPVQPTAPLLTKIGVAGVAGWHAACVETLSQATFSRQMVTQSSELTPPPSYPPSPERVATRGSDRSKIEKLLRHCFRS